MNSLLLAFGILISTILLLSYENTMNLKNKILTIKIKRQKDIKNIGSPSSSVGRALAF